MEEYYSNYFTDTKVFILGNEDLREPQKQAYCKAYEHFALKKKKTHAIIVLPTGVGKTGVIGTVPFKISDGRVLIITPQLTVKDTVIDSLNSQNYDNFWTQRKVIPNTNELPVIIEYEGDKTVYDVLNCANIVVLNIHKMQARLASSLINRVAPDFFDMVIVDEAHHSTANTWVDTLNYFSNAKVIKLTGTPIRSDGEKLSGEFIYEYKLSQAMANNYVKSLTNNEFIPEKVRFVIGEDSNVEYDESEILKLKDEEWVSKTVAYSEECSLQIVKESVRILKEKRQQSKIPHKIIAVACSIKHAKKITELYKSEGVVASIIHSDMKDDAIENVKNDIKNNRLDVIVNVGMLGEGYDHKYLSIAAIFRPFRSELPYAQFIGRVLRYIPEAETAEDNIARVVSHKLLFLDTLWKKYKKEIDESEIIKSLTDQNNLINSVMSYNEKEETSSLDIGEVHSNGGKLSEDAYIETEVLKRHKAETEEINIQIRGIIELLNISEYEAKNLVMNKRSNRGKLTRPDLVYKAKRKDIDSRIKEDVVPYLYVEYISNYVGPVKSISGCRLFLDRSFSWIVTRADKEDACLAIYFNQYLNLKIGQKRKDWEISDYERANELLDNQVEYVENILKEFYSNK